MTKIRRESTDEISSPLAHGMALELMQLRCHLVDYFNGGLLPDDERDLFMGKALECLENLEEVVKPDLFNSEVFRLDSLD